MEIKRNLQQDILFGKHSAKDLISQYGSPLYIYDEKTLRDRCQKIQSFCDLPNFHISYSAKANTSIALMRIIREEGLLVDAMSLGEIYLEKLAGYTNNEILFLSNNVDEATFVNVIDNNIKICVDSLCQLELYCSLNPGGEVYIRLNPGKGDGHHDKVITAGKVKFGIEWDLVKEAHQIADKYKVTITGFTMHIGSLFLKSKLFHQAAHQLLDLAKNYPNVEYIDFGGGIGIPYDRTKETSFPISEYSHEFKRMLKKWMEETGREPQFAIQPGRFVVAEAGVCLMTVQSKKINCGITFVGTDLGFNLLIRPEMYGAYHEIVSANKKAEEKSEIVTVVGNICESGDILGKDLSLPILEMGDLLLIRDTGAYGFSMSSNYNSLLRPPEILITNNGDPLLIRKEENLELLSKNQIF